jgi:hypothetical protein
MHIIWFAKGGIIEMDNLIIAFESIGEATLYVVNDETYDKLFELYENQKPGSHGYSEMMDKFWDVMNLAEEQGGSLDRFTLQWNTHDHFETPIIFNRILQVLQE